MANHALDDDDDVPLPPKGSTREKMKAFIVRRYNTRTHMSLILFACGFTAMITSWSLLHLGVHSMLMRYPLAISAAYGMFLLGVWTWLRATGLGSGEVPVPGRKAKGSGFDLPGIGSSGGSSSGGGSISGGGGIGRGAGSFDGGGASASFAGQQPTMMAAAMQPQSTAGPAITPRASSSRSSSSSSKFGGFDIDGDGIVLLVLAGLLILSIFLCSGYLVFTAPDVLTEAAFGAALTGTLSRSTANHAEGGWVAGVVKKTWWPFAIVLGVSIVFAWWSAAHYPQASTFQQAIVAAIHSH